MNAGEAVREAEAWFRERGFVSTSKEDARRAATIVRAWLARDVPAPAGRDLTAQDTETAWMEAARAEGAPAWQRIADRLSRIARPSGGVGQPDTAEPRIPTAAEIVDEYEASQLDDEFNGEYRIIGRRKDGTDVELYRSERHGSEGEQEILDEYRADFGGLHVRIEYPDRSPRSWSFPAPPPDDVTVVHFENTGTRLVRHRLGFWRTDDGDGVVWSWSDMLDDGTVVEGEPPRFERGFYRLARDVEYDDGLRSIPTKGVTVALVDVEGPTEGHDGGWVAMLPHGANVVLTDADLAAAGAERVEDR